MAKQAKAAKEKSSDELECTSVQRLAWNHEEVVLENEHVKVKLEIKDPELHGNFEKGESYKDVFSKA